MEKADAYRRFLSVRYRTPNIGRIEAEVIDDGGVRTKAVAAQREVEEAYPFI